MWPCQADGKPSRAKPGSHAPSVLGQCETLWLADSQKVEMANVPRWALNLMSPRPVDNDNTVHGLLDEFPFSKPFLCILQMTGSYMCSDFL